MTEIAETFEPFEFHHLYWGLMAIILSLFLHGFWHYLALIGGVYAVADDVCRHTGGLHELFCYLWGLTGWNWPFNL